MPDEIDRAQEFAQQHLERSLAAAQRRRLQDDPGDGICEDCGDDIAAERLAALPAAQRCLACQQKHEREQ